MTDQQEPQVRAETGGELSTSTRSTPSGLSAGKRWRSPLWLGQWEAAYPVPVPIDRIDAEIAAVERVVVPAEPKVIGSLLTKLVDALSPPPMSSDHEAISLKLREWWKRNREIYVSALADLPTDLLIDACDSAIKDCRFMPKPADIRKHVSAELSARNLSKIRLGLARDKALREAASTPVKREPLTPEQQELVDRAVGRFRSDRSDTPPAVDQEAA